MRIYPDTDKWRKNFYPGVDIDVGAASDIPICMTSFSRKVRDIRKRAGLNQTEFAAALGVGQSTVSRWESPKYEQMPDTDALLKIANFGGVSIATLWSDAETIHRKAGMGMYAKVIGQAKTDYWSESARWEEEQTFEVQIPAGKDWIEYSVQGFVIADDSMNRLYPNNSIAFVLDNQNVDEPAIVSGDRVLVVRKNKLGLLETTIREYRTSEGSRTWLWPLSDDPRYQAPYSMEGDGRGEGVVSVHIVGIVTVAFVFERIAQVLMED